MEHKKNILVETLSALFFIAEKMKVELCINKADGKLYIVKERDKETASLLPLNGENAPVVIFNPENLIFRYDFLNSSENNELLTAINGTATEQQRDNNGTTTESDSGQQLDNNWIITGKLRDNYEKLSLENRAVIGKGKINLPRISDLYSGDIAAEGWLHAALASQLQEGEAHVPFSGWVRFCGIHCLPYKDLIAPLYWGVGA